MTLELIVVGLVVAAFLLGFVVGQWTGRRGSEADYQLGKEHGMELLTRQLGEHLSRPTGPRNVEVSKGGRLR